MDRFTYQSQKDRSKSPREGEYWPISHRGERKSARLSGGEGGGGGGQKHVSAIGRWDDWYAPDRLTDKGQALAHTDEELKYAIAKCLDHIVSKKLFQVAVACVLANGGVLGWVGWMRDLMLYTKVDPRGEVQLASPLSRLSSFPTSNSQDELWLLRVQADSDESYDARV